MSQEREWNQGVAALLRHTAWQHPKRYVGPHGDSCYVASEAADSPLANLMQSMEDGALDHVASVTEHARATLHSTASEDQLRCALSELVLSSEKALRIAACRGERLTADAADEPADDEDTTPTR
ncbi:hypothetical protein H8N01_16515 [Streptomyces sp. AC536]|uniref:hypothetical protein n=1 Tax=Streptomyces buecherae TaxID=2763006 RepID=UPI00164E0E9D|nr:hypothetical protein [Streptomyces buecherae]MBC3984128.1 hypothetical protein [Streptomyces buecherae]QNJ41789.1 hypothetical protein H7H31_19885 [Streptomyces buecherae]